MAENTININFKQKPSDVIRDLSIRHRAMMIGVDEGQIGFDDITTEDIVGSIMAYLDYLRNARLI